MCDWARSAGNKSRFPNVIRCPLYQDDEGREIQPCPDGTWEYTDGSKVMDAEDPSQPVVFDIKQQMEYLRTRSVELSGAVLRRQE